MSGDGPRKTLILGGARSGKSRHAEMLGRAHGGALIYIATGEAGDGEMAERIKQHRLGRGPEWTTVEEPVALAAALAREAGPQRFVLVDCITLWISNLMGLQRSVPAEVDALCRSIEAAAGAVCLVSNEVGLGIVPDNAMARAFRDEAGLAHRRLAAVCDQVVLMVAGLPMRLK
ncbi:MAG TPA: bifunctional adenosylcobinamide kinase/adenosylcobinamide-phosphate guanylyltransferase [Aestuariivirgaceae bacterium]|jgi:adenosylcobinamide kinase / adenosylcobinamide-phosphate guanylyltransferase|nr:bifunctional adenosylcobinamide kinase/adenosylcobinamide-phosphate guanylyltransferase [Aestuariivirgaceae bacterium]